jgi:site-specific recombinase XerD
MPWPMSPAAIISPLRAAQRCAHSGRKRNRRLNAHAFRHGFARAYLTAGGDLGTLADILGHSTVEVTKSYYGIFTIDELQQKHDRHSPIARLGGCKNGE